MEEWTGRAIGIMHNNNITFEMLAKKLGVTKGYISLCLNCRRKTTGIKERIENAINELIAEKK